MHGHCKKIKAGKQRVKMGLLFRLILFFLVAFWGSITVVLVALNLLLHPLSFFHRKKREGQPQRVLVYMVA